MITIEAFKKKEKTKYCIGLPALVYLAGIRKEKQKPTQI